MLNSKNEKTEALAQIVVDVKGRSLWEDAARRFVKNRAAMVSLIILFMIVLFAIFGLHLTPWTIEQIDWEIIGDESLSGPSIANKHYFGADDTGRDLFARVVQGSRLSLMVGILGALVAVVIGTLYGAISGYIGGRVDSIMMRIVEILQSFPFVVLVIVLLSVFGSNIILLFVAIGAVSWISLARIVRGQTLSLKHKEYIEAAIATGVPTYQIVIRHIVPNVLGVVMVYASLLVPEMIMFESFLAFLGLGLSEPNTSLGSLISQGAASMRVSLWMLVIPMFFLVVSVFCFNFVGDGLRDALDPKDR